MHQMSRSSITSKSMTSVLSIKQDKEDPKSNIFSIEDMEYFVEQLKQNQNFKDYLFELIQNPQDSHESFRRNPKEKKKSSKKSFLTGFTTSVSKGSLEEDFYSIMMITEFFSIEWLLGFISFLVQIILAGIIIYEQTQTDFFETVMSIPIRVPILTRLTQFLAVVLAYMTQNELLSGLRTISMFLFIVSDENNNKKNSHDDKKFTEWFDICGIDENNRTKRTWVLRVLLPNIMKATQGLLVLVASFIVIVQLTSTVDVLKEYSALFVISSADNFFFNFADQGYFGENVMQKAEKVKDEQFEEKKLPTWLKSIGLIVICFLLGAWAYIVAGQIQGIYVKQAYPLCDHDETFNNTITFLDIIGDGKCQFPQGDGTNTIQCGWDGGDCDDINERYPGCFVNDFTLLGDGVCHKNPPYNSKACGFDNGDCMDFNEEFKNKYPNCNVENTGWIGDGFCNGGAYASSDCDLDGGDCNNCVVEDMNLLGNGNCDSSAYNTKECSYDGGDCSEKNRQIQETYPNCNVENIGWIEDGFCDEGEYNTFECSFDGNDCVPLMKLIGDQYNGVSNWDGGVLGHDGNIYAIPNLARKILKIDPSPNAANPTALVGDDLGGISSKWFGGVVGDNGMVYGVPRNAKSILSYNTTSEETAHIANNHKLLQSTNKFAGGVLASNGMIYFIPLNHNKVVKFDSSASVNTLTEIGNNLGNDGYKMWGGVLGSDGNIYGIPSDGTRVLKIDVVSDSTFFISDEYTGVTKWRNGALASDGNIYACPFHANKILQINIENQSTHLVGPALDGFLKWGGFVEGDDGFLYGIPYNSNELLRFDPINHTATLIPLQKDWREGVKWGGGVRTDNGYIYGIPYNANQVLSMSPVKLRP